MAIEVIDSGNVLVDGKNAGSLVDVLLNYSPRQQEILEACIARDVAARAERDAAVRAAVSAVQATHADQLGERDQQHAAAMADQHQNLSSQYVAAVAELTARHTEQLASLNAELQKLTTYVEAVSTTEEAQRLAREKAIADTKARIANDQKRLAKLEQPNVAVDASAKPPKGK